MCDRHPGEHKPTKHTQLTVLGSTGIYFSISAKWADNLIETPLEVATNEVDEAENHQGIERTLLLAFSRAFIEGRRWRTGPSARGFNLATNLFYCSELLRVQSVLLHLDGQGEQVVVALGPKRD